MSANERNERLFFGTYVAKPSPIREINARSRSNTPVTPPPLSREGTVAQRSPQNLRKNILIEELLKVQTTRHEEEDIRVPCTPSDDEPYCNHPLCSPPSKRKGLLASASKQVRNGIRYFIPMFRKRNKENLNGPLNKVDIDIYNSHQKAMHYGPANNNQRKLLSISAPVSVQNTPLLRHKPSGNIYRHVPNTTNVYKRISAADDGCDRMISPANDSKENAIAYRESKMSTGKSVQKSNSGGKHAMSNLKKPSIESKLDLPDVKASEIKWADYIQHRKQSQKKIVPPSPKAKKKPRNKNSEGNSTGTSSQTSPKIVTKDPCNWTPKLGSAQNSYDSQTKDSLSSPSTPSLSRQYHRGPNNRTTDSKESWKDMRTYSLNTDIVANTQIRQNSSYKAIDKYKSKQDDHYSERFTPSSPIPRRRNHHIKPLSSPNFPKRKIDEYDDSVQISTEVSENSFKSKQSLKMSNIHENDSTTKTEGPQIINNSTNGKLNLLEFRIPPEFSAVTQKGPTSLPSTPFQTRKSSRKNTRHDSVQNKPFQQKLDLVSSSVEQEHKDQNKASLQNAQHIRNYQYEARTSARGISPRTRKKNSVLTPEQTYRKQRMSDLKDTTSCERPNLKLGINDTSLRCRRASRTILSESSGSPNLNDSLNNSVTCGKDKLSFDLKKIYLFVADAQTQTEDLSFIENKCLDSIKDSEIDIKPFSCFGKDINSFTSDKELQILQDIEKSEREILTDNTTDKKETSNQKHISKLSLAQTESEIFSKPLNKEESVVNDLCISSTEAIYSTSNSNPSLETVVSEGKSHYIRTTISKLNSPTIKDIDTFYSSISNPTSISTPKRISLRRSKDTFDFDTQTKKGTEYKEESHTIKEGIARSQNHKDEISDTTTHKKIAERGTPTAKQDDIVRQRELKSVAAAGNSVRDKSRRKCKSVDLENMMWGLKWKRQTIVMQTSKFHPCQQQKEENLELSTTILINSYWLFGICLSVVLVAVNFVIRFNSRSRNSRERNLYRRTKKC